MEKLKQVLSYVIPVIGGLVVFFITTKEESNTKFHAIQSVVLGLIVAVAQAVCKIIPLFGGMIAGLCYIVFLGFSIVAIIKVVKDEEPALPLIGEITQAVLKNI